MIGTVRRNSLHSLVGCLGKQWVLKERGKTHMSDFMGVILATH